MPISISWISISSQLSPPCMHINPRSGFKWLTIRGLWVTIACSFTSKSQEVSAVWRTLVYLFLLCLFILHPIRAHGITTFNVHKVCHSPPGMVTSQGEYGPIWPMNYPPQRAFLPWTEAPSHDKIKNLAVLWFILNHYSRPLNCTPNATEVMFIAI